MSSGQGAFAFKVKKCRKDRTFASTPSATIQALAFNFEGEGRCGPGGLAACHIPVSEGGIDDEEFPERLRSPGLSGGMTGISHRPIWIC